MGARIHAVRGHHLCTNQSVELLTYDLEQIAPRFDMTLQPTAVAAIPSDAQECSWARFITPVGVDPTTERLVLALRQEPAGASYDRNRILLLSFRVAAAATGLEPSGRAELPDSMHLLHFDGTTALVATVEGVAYLSISEAAPRVIGTLATHQPPMSALPMGDVLVVASPSVLSVSEPPCPPQ